MKKNLFLGMTLGMALLANTAFAHLSGGYLSDIIGTSSAKALAVMATIGSFPFSPGRLLIAAVAS